MWYLSSQYSLVHDLYNGCSFRVFSVFRGWSLEQQVIHGGDQIVPSLFSRLANAVDEVVELPQVIVGQPIVVIGILYCNELFWFVGCSEEPFPRREWYRAIRGPVTLEQRAAVSGNLR